MPDAPSTTGPDYEAGRRAGLALAAQACELAARKAAASTTLTEAEKKVAVATYESAAEIIRNMANPS
jgi:hypothetical protein